MKIAELWANKVMAGDKTYAEIPAKLKDEIDTHLKKAGYKAPVKKATLKKS